MRDEFARRSQQAMGQVSPNGIYVQLYINGLYWGLYNIAERIDDVYASDYFGGNEADWDVIKPDDFGGQEAAEGNLLAWQTLSALAEEDLTIPANYQAVVDYVDLESLADYIILIHYIENTDWPDRNWYAVRNRVSGGGFKFIAWDSELSLKDKNRNIIDVDYPNTPARLFQRLRTNADFRMLFADRVYKHLFNDGALTEAEATARFVELTDLVYQPVVGESARWGDYRRDVYQRPDVGDQNPFELYTRDVHWVAQRNKMLAQYFPVRATNVISNYVGAGLYPTLAPPSFSQQGGAVTAGSVLTINNDENGGQGTIYYTVDGSDPRLPGGNISPRANNGGDAANVPIFSTVTVKARVRSGSTWSAVQQAAFFVPQDLSKLVINEIMYHPPDDTGLDGNEYEFLELLNTGSETLNLDNVTFAAGITYTFPPGATVPPGGFVVLASNATAFEAKYGFAPDGVYLDRLSNSGETVRLLGGLGGEIDSVTYTDLPPWPADADGLGSSLELIDAQLDNSLPENWKSSAAAGGTPGAPNSSGTTDPCATPPPVIVMNEINYNSSDTFNPEDWVELYNPGETAVSLTNWVFQDESAGFTIPAGTTLPSHGYLVLVRESALFSATFPAVSNYLGDLPFGFSGGGERLRLLSPGGCVVDEVTYDDVAPWPPAADGTGPTLTLLNPALDNGNPASWVASAMTGGTPGSANFPDGPTDNYTAYLPLIVRK
ncbi:MAG: lamin tail domain-containing protein [Anaerolineales bacterium]|nr:lamin tail domain-containing protein [Anaerolineales bacterium]